MTTKQKENVHMIVVLVLLVAGMLVTGTSDYEEAKEQEARAKENMGFALPAQKADTVREAQLLPDGGKKELSAERR